jgi:hypothetical protein
MSEEYQYKVETIRKGEVITSYIYDPNQKEIVGDNIFSQCSLGYIDIFTDIQSSHKKILNRQNGLEKLVTILK